MNELRKMAMQKSSSFVSGQPVKNIAESKMKADTKGDVPRQPSSLEEYVEFFNEQIVDKKSFRTGKIDDFGVVRGVYDLPDGKVPHVHQDHHYDKYGRVVRVDIYEKEFTKPISRFYFYEGESDKVMESVWIDRYGRIDNIHRYRYELETGLLVHRAEYDREGEIYYQIYSEFDLRFDPPRMTEEVWADKNNRQIQRYEYGYDDDGDPIMEAKYDSQNVMIGYNKFEYDEKKVNLVKKEWFGPDDKLKSYMLYENSDMDLTTKVSLFDGEGNLEVTQEFEYDQIGNLKLEKWINPEGQIFKQVRY